PAVRKISRTCNHTATYLAGVFPFLPSPAAHGYQAPFISCANRRRNGFCQFAADVAQLWMYESYLPERMASSEYAGSAGSEVVQSQGSQETMGVAPLAAMLSISQVFHTSVPHGLAQGM